LNMGPVGTYEAKYIYTYQGKEKGLAKIAVKAELKYVAPGKKDGGALPFKILNADLKSTKGGGTILFDLEKGRVVSSTLELSLEGTLKIEIGGVNNEIKLTQTQ